jgi:PadR family transcriptional regulator, regulatory protein PadR
MTRKQTNPEFLNGVPELLLLRLLAERPMYGYQLVQAIREASDAALEFGEGCVYPILHRLEAEGSLESSRAVASGRSRVVYRVTAAGKRQLAERQGAWEATVAAVRRVLQGGDRAETVLA